MCSTPVRVFIACVCLLCTGTQLVDSTLLHQKIRATLNSGLAAHQERLARLQQAADGLSKDGSATSSTLRTEVSRPARLLASSPAPIRILTELQLSSSTPESTQALIKQLVGAAVATMQRYLQIRTPVGPSGLLIVPGYIDAASCRLVNQQYARQGTEDTCSGAGFVPSFDASIPRSDIKSPYCGAYSARINPLHVLSSSCVAPDGSAIPGCTKNAAGTQGGAQGDIYLYVTSDDAYCEDNVAAFAVPCQYDRSSSRPIMGMLNLCSAALLENSEDKLIATILHEMTHTLGFVENLYSFFIDDQGKRLARCSSCDLSRIVQQPRAATGQRGNKVIVTPAVVREVRQQFNCPTLLGAALEDQGGPGSAGSHWEYELFQGDLMTPMAPSDAGYQRFSRLTLALMEDSGWYYGNWSAASYLGWGRNASCSMAQKDCATYAAGTPGQPYFCSTADGSTSCTFDGFSRGYCSATGFSVCGMVTTPRPSATEPPEPRCTTDTYANSGGVPLSVGNAAFGWTISDTSRCLATSLPMASALPSPQGTIITSPSGSQKSAFCWTASCTAGALYYTVLGKKVLCPAGVTIDLRSVDASLQGSLVCPKQPEQICRTLNCPASGCSLSNADCFEGSCVCHLGFAGSDCSLSLFTLSSSQQMALPPTKADAATSGPTSPATQPGGTPAPAGPSPAGPAPPAGGGLGGTTLWIVIAASVAVGVVIIVVVTGLVIASRRKAAQAAPPQYSPDPVPFTPSHYAPSGSSPAAAMGTPVAPYGSSLQYGVPHGQQYGGAYAPGGAFAGGWGATQAAGHSLHTLPPEPAAGAGAGAPYTWYR